MSAILEPQQEAQRLIDTIRAAQAATDKSLRGASFLATETLDSIALSAAEIFTRKAVSGISAENGIYLMTRFEEMGRRHKHTIPDDLRPIIFETLIDELQNNQSTLDAPAAKLIPATAYHGGIAPRLMKEFPAFAEAKSVFTYALYKHPTAPRKFLQDVETRIAGLRADPDLSDFREHDSVLLYAAMNSPADPKKLLERAKEQIAALAQDPEFAPLAEKSQGAFMFAAVARPNNIKSYLRKVYRGTLAAASKPKP